MNCLILDYLKYKKIVIYIFVFLSSFYLLIFCAIGTELQFIDKTSDSGLAFIDSPSWGLSWGDFDNDNWIDLYISNHNNPPSLYKNAGEGTFEDITDPSGLNFTKDFHGASWGDFDNDGDLDLYQVVGACSGTCVKKNFLINNEGNNVFTDIASQAGVEDPKGRGRIPVWFDFDNDGMLDLFIANETREDAPCLLFKNMGNGTFTDVTTSAGLSDIQWAVRAGVSDINNDGLFDLIFNHWGKIIMYLNNGDATFSKFQDRQMQARSTAIGDYDNDGDEDVYVVRGPVGDFYEFDSNILYYEMNASYPAAGFDIEIDNVSDINFDLYKLGYKCPTSYIFIGSNKYHPSNTPFSLDPASLQNQGEPTLTDSGIYIWFYPSDNKLHIRNYSTNPTTNPRLGGIVSTSGIFFQISKYNLNIDTNDYSNILLNNLGDGSFTDVTEISGLGNVFGGSSAAIFEDFDNDGDLDLYVVYTGGIFNEANRLFENDGQGYYTDITEDAGAQAFVRGRGQFAGVADYNNDGLMDILVLNGAGSAPFNMGQRVLLENETINNNNWIQIDLVGKTSNRDGIGTIVDLAAGTLMLRRQQRDAKILHFGIGDNTHIDRITVRWPSGIVRQISNTKANKRLKIEEPEISVSLIPSGTTISQGSVLAIKVITTNNTSRYKLFLLATNVKTPVGLTYPPLPGALYISEWITLPPYQSDSRFITHDISLDATAGAYEYNSYVGRGIYSIWNEDHFQFNIVPYNNLSSTISN